MVSPLAATLVFLSLLLLGAQPFVRAQTRPAPPAQQQPAETQQPTAKAKPAYRVVSTPSSNYRATSGRTIDTVVVHYMSGINVDPANWANPALNRRILQQNGVSAHYIIDRAGTVYRLVDEKNVAWHAGGSIMPSPDNRRNVNSFSIGIELIATARSGFTEAQYTSLSTLITGIKSRHAIQHIVGHDQISGQRAVRMGLRRDVKPDPGSLFDWTHLHALLKG